MIMKNKREKEVVSVLYEKHLKEFLERFEVYEKFIKGEAKCENCNEVVNTNNLGLLEIKDRKITFMCNKPECIREIS